MDFYFKGYATAMRQNLEDKCEVVGQGLSAYQNVFSLSTVARVCDGSVVCHGNNDACGVMCDCDVLHMLKKKNFLKVSQMSMCVDS